MNQEAPESAGAASNLNSKFSLQFQLFPHSDTPLHIQDHTSRPFIFSPVEKIISQGTSILVGRKIDRSKDVRGSTREDRAQNNVSVDSTHMSTTEKNGYDTPNDCIAFRSKVVSRYHAELFVGEDRLVIRRTNFSYI
jgi:hypothetical protein